MNKPKFATIIFPSRGRLDLVEQLLKSIENNTHNKEWIEVISICDQDDKDTINLFTKLSQEVSFDFYFIVRKRNETLNLPKDYYAPLLKLRSDSYITWGLGNDTEIITKDWDLKLYAALQESLPEFFQNVDNNSKYYYFTVSDNSHWTTSGNINKYGDQSCCFPILSSNYCTDAKEIMPSEFPAWKGDTVLHMLMSVSPQCQIVCVNEFIEIQHYCFHNNTYKKDEIAERVENTSLEFDKYNQDISVQQLFNNRPFLK